MLVITLITAMLTFSLARKNVLLDCVQLLLFGAYLMLMFDRCRRDKDFSSRTRSPTLELQ